MRILEAKGGLKAHLLIDNVCDGDYSQLELQDVHEVSSVCPSASCTRCDC